jgi:alkylation response protein AidB-like acyl-CoA dehydrogenase
VERARAAAAVARPHAAEHDRTGSFPVEGLQALHESGLLRSVLPVELGGEHASLPGLTLAMLELAAGDASLALVTSMHLTLLGRARDAGLWPSEAWTAVSADLAREPALINSLASEPETGSPSRGALPTTRAVSEADGFRISGRKNFCSGSGVLRWATVSARVESQPRPRLGTFLVPLRDGVEVEQSWDSMGLRATCSHTLVFADVVVPTWADLPRPPIPDDENPVVPHERAWALIVGAVYLGVAEAARGVAVRFARERRPSSLSGESIGRLPHIRAKVGELDLRLYQARGLLISTVRE